MPLFGPTYYCPDIDCEFSTPLKKGAKCPQCGAEAKPFGMRDGAALFATKKSVKKTAMESEKVIPKSGKGGYYCPNPKCANVKELVQGEKCPACGTEAQSDDHQEAQPSVRSGEVQDEKGGAPLFTETMTDDELRKKIHLGVERLNSMGEQASVHEQNSIIIMQNELILRHLRKK